MDRDRTEFVLAVIGGAVVGGALGLMILGFLLIW